MKDYRIRQAILLAAGKGTRLKPVTDLIPKCMVQIWGKPVLEWNIEHLVHHGVTDIVINLHYLPEVVQSHIGDGSRWGVRITYSYENTLLGTAGAVKKVANYWVGRFIVWYGDNLSTCNLDRLTTDHINHGGIGTIALIEREDVSASGVIELNEQKRVTHFFEKPLSGTTNSKYVNAGIYVLEPEILDYIPSGYSDFGKDIFPNMLADGRLLYGYCMQSIEKLWWIDTVRDLNRVLKEKEGIN
jgi:NDP-sugar pyrophosphorylase family protein